MPTFSIIVPVYNSEEYISECIESVLNQTYDSWELILVDDGSVDRSGEICRGYELKDSRITVISKKNTGALDSRLKGLKTAKGKYILGLDADDLYDQDLLEKVRNVSDNEKADLIIWGYKCIGEANDIWIPLQKEYKNNEEIIYDIISYNNHSLCNKAIRRERIQEDCFDDIPKNIKVSIDYAQLIPMLLNIDNAVILDQPLYNYRIRKESVSHSISITKLESVGIVSQYVADVLNKNGKLSYRIAAAIDKTYLRAFYWRLKEYIKENGYNRNEYSEIRKQKILNRAIKNATIKEYGIRDTIFLKRFKI